MAEEVEAASVVVHLAVHHARLTRRRGMSRAQIAVAHSMLITAYYMLKRRALPRPRARVAHATQRRSSHPPALAQLEKLGHSIQLDTVA